uniref:SFRICE_036267 n=1 Tax=Spodoptera frugiperda TaxID=7108 RepID=A0A2H1W1E8_SPOFR
MKYLGVIIDEELKFHNHIDALTSRIRKLIYIFKSLRHIAETSLIKMVYLALCQSLITYCITAWGGAAKTTIIKLERAQRTLKETLKVSSFLPIRYPTAELYQHCGVLTIRQLFFLNIILKKHAELTYDPNAAENKKRNAAVCTVTRCRTSLTQQFYGFLGSHLYNKINKEQTKIKSILLYAQDDKVITPSSEEYLASMATKFRKNIWKISLPIEFYNNQEPSNDDHLAAHFSNLHYNDDVIVENADTDPMFGDIELDHNEFNNLRYDHHNLLEDVNNIEEESDSNVELDENDNEPGDHNDVVIDMECDSGNEYDMSLNDDNDVPLLVNIAYYNRVEMGNNIDVHHSSDSESDDDGSDSDMSDNSDTDEWEMDSERDAEPESDTDSEWDSDSEYDTDSEWDSDSEYDTDSEWGTDTDNGRSSDSSF